MLMKSFGDDRATKTGLGVIERLNASIIMLIIAGLAGCAQPTGYTKASSSFLTATKGYGYSDKRINGDEFSIVVLGNPSTSKARAAEIALLRAAHLTKEEGRTHFTIIRQREETTESVVTTSVPLFLGGVFVMVPVGEQTAKEPMAILLIRLLPSQAVPSRDALDAAAVIEEMARRLE
jgi:hypothetical protein